MTEFKDHFSGVAGRYAEFRPEYPRELFEWIASVARRNERVWDCATGNGQAAIGLSEFFDEVIATDASAEQIASARPGAKVRYAVASAEDSRLEPESVDVITVAQAAHWFDLPQFYAEARRVLRKDGLLVVWCYGSFRFGRQEVDDLIDEFYGRIVGPFWPPERRYVEENYRTLEFPLNQIATPQLQMRAEFTRERLAGYLRTWSATQRFMKLKGIDPVSELDARLEMCWSPKERLSTKLWPIGIRAGCFSC